MAKLTVQLEQQKKPYRTPTLRTFGNVQQITQSGRAGTAKDAPAGEMRKTGIGTV
jgi:hypothetical protein